MRRLVLSPAATRDLAEIGDYIALDDPHRAVTFVEEIRDRALQVAERPESFPSRPDLAPNLRVALHRRYLLLFTHTRDEVRIERVLHGARDLAQVLRS